MIELQDLMKNASLERLIKEPKEVLGEFLEASLLEVEQKGEPANDQHNLVPRQCLGQRL